MVQFLPAMPTFGSRLEEVLGQASKNIAQGFQQRAQQKANAEFERTLSDPNATATQKYIAFSRLPKERQAAAGHAFGAFIGPGAQAEKSAKELADLEAEAQRQQGNIPTPPGAGAVAAPQQQAQQGSMGQPQPVPAQGNLQAEAQQQPQQPPPQPLEERIIPGVGLTENQLRRRAAIDDSKGKLAKGQLESWEKQKSNNYKDNTEHLNKIFESRKSLQQTKSDLGTLSDLEERGNLPSRFTAAMFTKNGELSDAYLATLSSDAQEYLKIIVNRLKGAKDTFGSRVTNFDASLFLKGLPTFLNSPQGRKQILRGLQNSNEAELLYTNEAPKILEQMGGAYAVPWSQVESQFEEKFLEQQSALRRGTNRPGDIFPELKDVPGKEGQRVRNQKTGQIMIYRNGKWHSEGSK